MGLLQGACMSWRGRGGWVWAGLAALDLSGQCELTSAGALPDGRCCLSGLLVGRRLLQHGIVGNAAASEEGAARTEGALMETVDSLIADLMPSVFCQIHCNPDICCQLLFFLIIIFKGT